MSTSNNVDVHGQQWHPSSVGKPCFVFSVSITSQVVVRGGCLGQTDSSQGLRNFCGNVQAMFENMCYGIIYKNMEGHLELQVNICIFNASWPSQSHSPCDHKQHHKTHWYWLFYPHEQTLSLQWIECQCADVDRNTIDINCFQMVFLFDW